MWLRKTGDLTIPKFDHRPLSVVEERNIHGEKATGDLKTDVVEPGVRWSQVRLDRREISPVRVLEEKLSIEPEGSKFGREGHLAPRMKSHDSKRHVPPEHQTFCEVFPLELEKAPHHALDAGLVIRVRDEARFVPVVFLRLDVVLHDERC